MHRLIDFTGATISQVLSQTVFYMFVQLLKFYKEYMLINLYLANQLHYTAQSYVKHYALVFTVERKACYHGTTTLLNCTL